MPSISLVRIYQQFYISRGTQTFTGSNHVVRIEGLDVGRSLGYPVSDNVGVAAGAARLISQLPRKDGRGSLVARDNSLDVRLAHALDLRIGVPSGLIATIGIDVGIHTTVIIPRVHKGNDKLDTVLLSSGDNVIKTLQTISTSVDGSSTGGLVVELEVDGTSRRDSVHIIETPNSQNLETGLLQVFEDGVNIRIVRLEWQPVRVRSSEVLGLAINVKLLAIHLGERAAARGGTSA